jgi:hypothetical protein
MQQLLDKWERLRTSEYLRPDEKLMLNHCISDLKRFTDHSGEVTEMVGNRTAVEWFAFVLYQKFKLEGNGKELNDLFEQAKEMEKEIIIKAYNQDLMGGLSGYRKFNDGEDYYNETYGGNK